MQTSVPWNVVGRRNRTGRAISLLMLMIAATSVAGEQDDLQASGAAPTVAFEWFRYSGNDAIFESPLPDGDYQNPIVAGFFPDPSIVRRGDDYYMVHSSFAYTPGIPVLHSRNLVDWQIIGHVITRDSQVDLDNLQVSRGLFAPTIRYHAGLFYVINTAVDAGGNYYVTARDPAGPWSDPVWLPGIDGIDPDLFFDDDGRVYIAHNGPPEGTPLYDGHRAIWLWEYDLDARAVKRASGRVIVNGGVDLSKQPIWIEAPHLYKVNGWYYLLCAEGGTGFNHSEVVFRTRSLDEAFVPYDGNPILTQRDLPANRPDPVAAAGHADLVQAMDGRWWAVFLAVRPYAEGHFNIGRETWLLPVTWQDDWPVILEAGKAIPYRMRRPAFAGRSSAPTPLNGNFTWQDEFSGEELDRQWNLLRGTRHDWYRLADDALQMTALPQSMAALGQPAYIGRRQQHLHYEASAQLRLPDSDQVSGGIVALQNERFHYYAGVRRHGDGYEIFLERADGSEPAVIEQTYVAAEPGDPLILGVRGKMADMAFYYRKPGAEPVDIAEHLDARLLSTEIAGGFVGTTLGMHARLEAIENAN